MPRPSRVPAEAADVEGLPRKRTFVVLRFGFLIAASYLLLVTSDFGPLPAPFTVVIAAALASNLLLTAVPCRFFEGVALPGGVLLLDVALVTVALLYSGEFGGEFFLLYFAVLFIAAVGESLVLVIVAAVIGSGAYLWIAANRLAGDALWRAETLIRLPFLLMVAVFFGYFVVRLRRERRRATQEAEVAAGLEEARRAIADHASQVEETNRRLEIEVTERAQAERQLEDANLKLKRASQTKTDFISVVSHELRTPLASIQNALDLMRSPKLGELDAQRLRFLEMAQRNTRRLAAIIDDLLDLSKVEAGKVDYIWEEVDLEPLLRDLCASFEGQAQEASVGLELRYSDGVPLVWADSRRIEQVVTNLVSNALKHTGSGGKVTLWVRPVPDGAEVAVTDTGTGISPEDLERIFERFYQVGDELTRRSRGTGLGLSIVRQLLAGHGSRIHVESDVGKGSRFWFKLPTLSSETVEELEFETQVMRYRTRANFFSILVLRLGDPATGIAEAFPDETELRKLAQVVSGRFPRASDDVIYQRASRRILLVMLMTPASGAEIVRQRLGDFLAGEKRENGLSEVVISGPASYPDDGSTGREVVARALSGEAAGTTKE